MTPDQSLPQDISVFVVPKKPSILELSGEHPLRDIDLVTPASSHMAARPGRRQWHPQSPWVTRWARSASVVVASAALSMPSDISAFGEVDVTQLTTGPSKQSRTELRYSLPAGMKN